MNNLNGLARDANGTNPLVSVVIPTYNDPELLQGAVERTCRQTWQNLDIIVVNDGSSQDRDAELKGLESRDERIRVIESDRNLGVPGALMLGASEATGAYIYLGSTNDPCDDDFIEVSVRALMNYPSAGICFSDPGLVHGWSDSAERFPLFLARKIAFFCPDELAEKLRKSPFHISSHTVLFRSDRLQHIGGERPEFGLYADWFAVFVLALRDGAVYLPRVMAYSRIHDDAYSKREAADAAERIKKASMILHTIKQEFPEILPRLKRSRIASSFGISAVLSFRRNQELSVVIDNQVVLVTILRRVWNILRWVLPPSLQRGLRSAAQQSSLRSRSNL